MSVYRTIGPLVVTVSPKSVFGSYDQVPHTTGLYSHSKRLEALISGFKKKDCIIHIGKTKALISFAKTIWVFVFVYMA